MPIELSRIGHAAVRVRDLDESEKFYTDVLGFKLVEEDPEHGAGVFMSLGSPYDGHVMDISQVEDAGIAKPPHDRNTVGVAHIALKVDSHEDPEEAYDHLVSSGVLVDRMMEHVNQRSLYFAGPDGNRLEIYSEFPTSKELFERGRGDRDLIFSFDDPLPQWAEKVPSDWDSEKTVDSYHRGTRATMG